MRENDEREISNKKEYLLKKEKERLMTIDK